VRQGEQIDAQAFDIHGDKVQDVGTTGQALVSHFAKVQSIKCSTRLLHARVDAIFHASRRVAAKPSRHRPPC
jgi:hypothetical protein